MALRHLSASANSSAATWHTIVAAPTIQAAVDISLGTGNNNGPTWTAPNTTNAVTGCWIFPTVISSGTLTVTLLESAVAKNATTVNVSDLTVNEWNFISITPYTYTTTGAGAYRFKIVCSVTGNSAASNNAGATLVVAVGVDDRAGALGGTDNLWVPVKILTGAGTATFCELTIDSNLSFGAGSDTNAVINARNNTGGCSLQLGAGATSSHPGVIVDTSASRTLTMLGSAWLTGLQIGTVASPVSSANKVTWQLNQNGTAGNYGITLSPNYVGTVQGAPKKTTTNWKAFYVSGTGTTANPVILSADIGSVDDELAFSATNGTGQTEYRFITSKPTATSYVLSNTVGGADNALTNTHTTNCEVVNLERNIIFTTTNASHGLYFNNYCTTAANCDWDWFKFKYISGSATANKASIQMGAASASATGQFDYFVLSTALGTSSAYFNVSSVYMSHTGVVIVKGSSTGACINFNVASSKSITDLFILGNAGSTFTFNGAATMDINNARLIDNSGGGIVFTFSSNINYVNANIQGTTGYAVTFGSSIASNGNFSFTNSKFGNFLANTSGNLAIIATKYSSALFDNCLFSDSTPTVANMTSAALQSEMIFHAFNQTNNKHFWLTSTATNQATGAALDDTYVRTAGNLTLRMYPIETTTGSTWEFLVPARVGKYAAALGFIKMNSVFAGDADASCKVELFLPGSTTADFTQNMTLTTTEQVFNVYANYLGSVDANALVRVTAKANDANAYVYVSDIFNGTNSYTGMKIWYKGKPSQTMFEQLGDAAAVWAVATSTLTTTGTTGKMLVDTNGDAELAAIKP